jgi:hypothetical protein
MADYTVDPTNENEPTDARGAKWGAEELRALKAYLADQISTVVNNPKLPAGDCIFSFHTAARTGWVKYSVGTDAPVIGNVGSGAAVRANADTAALYALLWALPDTKIYNSGGVETTKGVSAGVDFAALKAIAWPDMYRRVFAVLNPGSNDLGDVEGARDHVLTIAQMPAHNHGLGTPLQVNGPHPDYLYSVNWGNPTHGMQGNNEAHNNMQPTIYMNLYISLG